ncbi:MAG: nicotinate-nucleotide adenylyltransferase [Candidatus Pacebacteria bacterium]|nr:nicotinate-nucleotide adenylyltransferase [Candidatus Paceibacterota bacterium]
MKTPARSGLAAAVRPCPLDPFNRLKGKSLRIGILGGSFNPAHLGHVQLSLLALKKLGLDQVWWLVSPQNPLKSVESMAPLAWRVAEAEAILRHHHCGQRIKVSAIEAEFGTGYTIDSLRQLRRRFPRLKLVWLMGSDGFAHLHLWRDWRGIMAEIPMAIFSRQPFARRPLACRAAVVFGSRRRVGSRAAVGLAGAVAPVFVTMLTRLEPSSSTAIRRRGVCL